MEEYILPKRYNPDNKPVFTWEELDIGQAFMNGHCKGFCIKISPTMYFSFDDNRLSRLTPELLATPSRIYFKCDYEVW